jgi:hypothetical protein
MSSVDSRTLSEVSHLDWEQLDADTQYLTHNIHRYSGKFIPQIASQAIEILTSRGDRVVDPYCGSGTVLLESALRGRVSIGLDLNPLAVLISRVKTQPVEPARLHSLQRQLTEVISPVADGQLSLGSAKPSVATRAEVEADPRWEDEWYQKWFAEERRFELIAIAHAIDQVEDIALRSVALVALSDVLRRASNANTSYPNVMFDARKRTPPSIVRKFLERLNAILKRIESLAAAVEAELKPSVVLGDASAIPLDDSSADAVITHPPYIGSIPYAEYGVLSLKWLGFEPKKIDSMLTGGRRQSKDVVERFSRGFELMLQESRRVLKAGGHLFMLLGSPQVRGERIDLPAMALELGAEAGLELVASHSRRGGNRRANLMEAERLLFFRRAV